ncbi:acetyl-CoA sensor PanZ family protein, partial [Salmonella enterica subsp. enterica serovar Montevideo]|nr:acetyl-CoA sensor PanZ family protein [Salmonella enterica subsp. enterica serovar Montevideo]
VGQYLVEEVIRDNPNVSSWWMADVGVEDRSVMAAFMQALGFTVDEIEHSGAPDRLTIRARSADFRETLNTRREKSWHQTTVG